MPSGILWSIIATERSIPNFKSIVLNTKVAIPSGILWSIIPSIVINPVLYNLLSSSFNNLVNIWLVKKPTKKHNNPIKIDTLQLLSKSKLFNPLGIKSIIDNVIITPPAKDSDLDIHIIVDKDTLDCDPELYTLLYGAYRSLFNKNYDITIKGIPVEIYVELY